MFSRRKSTNDQLRDAYKKETHTPPIPPRIVRAKSVDDSSSAESPRTRKKSAPNIELNQLVLKDNPLSPDKAQTHVLLTGIPGSGKTTTAIELANQWAITPSSTAKFEDALLINLNLLANPIWKSSYSQKQLSDSFLACFIHYCIRQLPSKHMSPSSKTIELEKVIEVLSSNNPKFLIVDGYDGLNEDQDRIIQEVYRYNDIIITSRFELPILRHHKFQLYFENLGLDDRGVTSFIKAHLGDHSSLIEFLNQNEAVKEICRVPLNLELLCQIWPKDQALRNTDENHSISITRLYETLIYWKGRKYIEEVEKNPIAVTKAQIMAHPIISFMQERAFNSLFGIINPTLIDKYNEPILERLEFSRSPVTSDKSSPAKSGKSAVTQAIDQFGLLKIEFGQKFGELDYVFTHNTFKEFMAAGYLRDALMSPEPKVFIDAMKLISLHSGDAQHLMVMKFLSGLITYIPDQSQRELTTNRFWKAVIANNEEILKVPGDDTTKLLMHLLAQTIDSTIAGPIAPKAIIDYVDGEVAKDPNKWSESLVDSHYVSPAVLKLLEPHDRDSKIQAIKILPYLNIGHTALTTGLIADIKTSNDPEIIETALHGLGHMASRPVAYSALLEFATDPRPIVAIIATEILGTIANQDALPLLLNNLDNPNILIVSNAFNAVKNYKDALSKSEIEKKLIQKLAYKGPNEEIIIEETIILLDQLKLLNSRLVDRFFTQLDGSKLETTDAINSLANLIRFDPTIVKKLYDKWLTIAYGVKITLKCQIIKIIANNFALLPPTDQEVYYNSLMSKFSIMPTSDTRIRVAAIEAFSAIFSSIILDKKNTIFDLIIKCSTNQNVEGLRVAAINQFATLSDSASPQQQKSLYDNIIANLESPDAAIQQATVMAVKNIHARQNIVNNNFVDQINQYFMAIALDNGGNAESIDILSKLAYMSPTHYNPILIILLETASNKFSSTVKHASIKAIYKLINNAKSFETIEHATLENIHELMLTQSKNIESIRRTNSFLPIDQQIGSTQDLEDQDYMSLQAASKLTNFIPTAVAHTLNEFLGKIGSTKATPSMRAYVIHALTEFADKIPIADVPAALALLMSKAAEPKVFTEVAKFIKQLKIAKLIGEEISADVITFLSREVTGDDVQYAKQEALLGFIDQLEEPQQSELLEFMLIKYINGQEEISPQEQNFLYKTCYLLLSQASKSHNITIQNKVLNLLKTLGYNDNQIIAMISESLGDTGINIQKQLQMLFTYKEIFKGNAIVLTGIEQTISIIQSSSDQTPIIEAFEDLDKLTTYTARAKLDAKITRDAFFLNGKLQKLAITPDMARSVYKALPQEQILQPHSLYKKDAHNSIVDRSKLDPNLWKISILNEEGAPEHTVLIMEKQTVFTDTTVRKFTVERGQLIGETYSTMNLDLQEIFGEYSEDTRYRVRSFMATEEEHTALLDHFKEHIDLHPNIYSSKVISHNELIRRDNQDIRQVIEEFRIELGEVKKELQLTKQQIAAIQNSFKIFAISQEHMAKLLSAMDSINSIRSNPALTPYQEKLYVTIVHELMATYMMAITMVYNSGSMIGNVGNFLEAIGSHVPVAGAGVSLLGYILGKVSQVKQEQISSNLANMAIGPVEMEMIAKKLALAIATSQINVSELSDKTIYKILTTILSIGSPEDLLGVGISYILSLDSSSSSASAIELERKKGEHDGLLIVDALVSFVSAGSDVMISSDGGAANLKILIDYLVDNNIISNVLEQHMPLLVNPKASVSDLLLLTHTPQDVKALSEKAEKLTSLVFAKCIELLESSGITLQINLAQKKLFIEAYAKVLVGEHRVDGQPILLELIDKSSSFKDSLVSKLADAVLDQNAFIIDENSKLVIDRNFLVDAEDLAQAAQVTANFFHGRLYIGYDNEKITISSRVFIDTDRLYQPPNSPVAGIDPNFNNPNLDAGAFLLLENDLDSSSQTDAGTNPNPETDDNKPPPPPDPATNHDINMGMALTGAAMINYAESKHSLKYLFTHYIPIMPYITKVTDYLGITEYEHAIDTGIFIGGAIVLARTASGDYTKIILPGVTYAAKPYAYMGRDYVLSYIYNKESNSYLSEGIKFTAYIVTDAGLSIIISSPLILVHPITLVHSILHGVGSGAVHYYNQLEHKPNTLSNGVANGVTTVAIGYLAYQDTTLSEKIIYSSVALNYLSNLHYMSKTITNMVQDFIYGKHHSTAKPIISQADDIFISNETYVQNLGENNPPINNGE